MPVRSPTSRVSVSYRREDAAAYAGRLRDCLSGELGSENVFIDVDGVAPA